MIIRQTLSTMSDPLLRPKNVIPVLEEASRALHGLLEMDDGAQAPSGRVAAEAMDDAAALFYGNVVLMGGRRKSVFQ